MTLTLFFISSFVDSAGAFFGLYATAFAFNHGVSYMAPIQSGWLWFPKRPGLVSGIIIGGFGSGALIFDNVIVALINPDNVEQGADGQYDDAVNERFVKSWRIMLACWVGIAITGVACVFRGPEKEPEILNGEESVAKTSDYAQAEYHETEESRDGVKEALVNRSNMRSSTEIDKGGVATVGTD